jgi:hypothetical protein
MGTVYNLAVRRWAAILLMLLVPLRVIAAETMTCVFALPHASAQASMPDDCPMMKTGHAPASPQQPGHDHEGCSGCQLCMAFAMPDETPVVLSSDIGDSVPVASNVSFRSAEVARALKPPIS